MRAGEHVHGGAGVQVSGYTEQGVGERVQRAGVRVSGCTEQGRG